MDVYIYDLNRDPVFDPERATDRVTNITFQTMWPKGYGVCSFQVRRYDLLKSWIVKESYGVIIRDGQKIIYQGRIETIQRTINGPDETIQIETVGWYVALQERLVHKFWVDNNALSRFEWDDAWTDEQQTTFVPIKRNNWLEIQYAAGDLTLYSDTEPYVEIYKMPTYIRRITFNWAGRSGEGCKVHIGNYDQGGVPCNPISGLAASEGSYSVSGATWTTGSEDLTLAQGNTRRLLFAWCASSSDIYDQNDRTIMNDLTAYAHYHPDHPDYAAPGYTAGEMVIDCLLIANDAGKDLSEDWDLIDDPGVTINPFTVEKPTPIGDVVLDVAKYGDSSANTWGLCVWDKTGSTDGLPKCEFKMLDKSDYDYILDLNEWDLKQFSDNKNGNKLYNYIVVEYTDEKNKTNWLTPDDEADLKDAASIAAEYRREKTLSVGQADATRALAIGKRYLAFHKTRLRQGSFTAVGKIRTKAGNWLPVAHVRAGSRIYLPQLDEIFFIRQTNYNDSSQTLTLTPDLPEDNIQFELARLNKLDELANRERYKPTNG